MKFFIFIGTLFLAQLLSAQDIYDYNHSLEYARYLGKTQQYNIAAEEYERLLFMQPQNDSVLLNLVITYRKNGNLKTHIKRFDTVLAQPKIKELINIEIANALILNHEHEEAGNWINTHSITDSSKQRLLLVNELMSQNFRNSFVESNLFNSSILYAGLLKEATGLKYKKPWVGGTLSAILPGAGKVYAGEWKDGLLSLIIVGSTAFQSYRGFSKKGITSGYGWAMGTLAFGFYSANIYGACKSVKAFNKNLKNSISNRAEDLFRNNL